MDISDDKPRQRHEHKARQVIRLLIDRIGIGVDCVLIIEEAHKLSIDSLQALKQFWELENGFSKLLGIILIGQPELEGLLDESAHPDLRELIRRTQLVKIGGLNGDLREYLIHKFKRVGASVDKIITEDAIEALSRRLTFATRDGKSKISHAYPLLVNNWVTRAVNLAHEMGETQVTVEVVEAL
jgi:type II secretory pathway predicted ATPase ExeA